MSQLSPDQMSELAGLNQKLQDAADSLAAFCKSQDELPRQICEGGEIRSYYLSPSTLDYEQTLHKEYKVEGFPSLLNETYTRLVGLAKVMTATPPNAKLKGQVVAGLGGVLDQVSQLVWRMARLAAKCEKMEGSATRTL